MRSLAVYTLLVTAFATSAFSFGYYDSVTRGTMIQGLSPSTTALGSVRALGVQEPAGIFFNPAQTAVLPFGVQLAGSSIQWSEQVIQSDVEKMTRTYLTYDNGTAVIVYPAGMFVIGAGIAKVGEFGYEGSHTVYDDPDDPETGVAVLYADGAQWETLGSVSAMITDKMSAGFSAGMRSVHADYSYSFNSHQFLIPDSSSAWSVDDQEFAWHAGVAINGEMFDSGVSYSSETDYMDDIVAFGASALAPHLKNATVGFEAQVASPLDHNRFTGDLFVKMPFNDLMNAQISVSFDDNRVASRAGLGFGIGFGLRLGRVDIGAGLLNRFRSRKNTAFPSEQSDRVDDSFTMISLGVSSFFGNP
ncbi:MAG: hypothetical protein J7K88_10035 [Candidatus Fermentibacteraceae bacterium]|nr:hypothetical protein [Candidatus Fermentibacteraceae bacterium]